MTGKNRSFLNRFHPAIWGGLLILAVAAVLGRAFFISSRALVSPSSGDEDLYASETFAQEKSQVLLLNSYHKGYRWSDEIVRGVEAVLSGRGVDLHVEYLDTKRQFDRPYQDLIKQLLLMKHDRHQYDLVMTADNNAFDFMRAHFNGLFKGVPRVFCGMNDLQPGDLDGLPNVTGVNERADLAGNLRLIKQLHPACRRIVVITDDTTTGRKVQNEVRQLMAVRNPDDPQIDLLYDVSFSELLAAVRQFDAQTIGLYTFFMRDKAGEFIDPEGKGRMICGQSNVPVYGAWSFHINQGIVGGYLINGYDQGAAAAGQVLQILDGTPADQIPVLYDTPVRCRMDFRKMERFGIARDQLPAGCEVIHQPSSYYARHKRLIWNAAWVFGMLLLALTGVLFGLIRSRRSGRQYRMFFENSSDAMLVIEDGRFIQCNESAATMLGYDQKNDLLGLHPFELSPVVQPDGRKSYEMIETLMAETCAHGNSRFEWMHLRKDGTRIPVEVSLTVIQSKTGPQLHTIWHDLTDRNRAKAALKKSEEKFRGLVESSSDWIWEVDAGFVYSYASPQVESILGYTPQEIIGKTPFDLMPPEEAAWVHTFFEGIEKNRVPIVALENENVCRDGRRVSLETSAVPFFDEAGNLAGYRGVDRDITQRKQAEAALLSSMQKLAWHVEQTPLGVISLNLDFEVTEWNPAAERIFGYTLLEAIGKPADFIIPKDARDQTLQVWKELCKNSGSVELSMENITKKGGRIECEWHNTALIDDSGKVVSVVAQVMDITDRKRAEKQMLQQRYLLEKAQELGHIGTWELDLKQNQLQMTDENCRIFGLPPGTVVTYERFLEKIHPADREVVKTQWAAALKGAPFDLEHRLLLDGQVKWVREKADVEMNSQGVAVGAVGFAQDITERKRAADEVESTRAFLDTVVDLSPFPMWVSDAAGTMIRGNRAQHEALNLTGHQLIGVYNVLEDENLKEQGVMPRVRAVFEKHESARVSLFWRSQQSGVSDFKGGRDLYVDASLFPILNAQGELTNVVCQWVDITDRKHGEEERERLMLAIEQAVEIVIITDADAHIQYVNPAFEQVTGYSRAEVIGKNPRLLQSGQVAAGVYRKMWETITAGRPWIGYLVNKKKNGGIYTEEATISPVIGQDGRITNYVAAKRDVTRELELQAQLRQAQKMEAVGQMAGGIAHDFNNLLQVISGYAELVQMDIGKDHPLVPAIGEIGKAAHRGKGLINQLLAFSRRQVIKPVDLNLNALIEPVLNMLRGLIGENISLDYIPGHDLGTIHADRGLIEQVLMNLCANARDAMPDGGTLAIETGHVLLDGEFAETHTWAVPGRYVLLSVSDTGCGINPQTLDHIFEPFFSTKEVGKGTGLGLSTVFGIVQQHDGGINAVSEVGKGTVFKVYFPVVNRAVTEVSRPASNPVTGGTETILVAEDDEAVLKLAEHILMDAGYSVLIAKNGEEAIQVFEQHMDEIDMAMFDVIMPRMGGKQAMDHILKLRPGLPHLFASGYSENAVHTNFKKKRGLHLLSKPYQAETLLRKIREVLDGE